MKYSSAVEPVKNQLLGANSILVALPEATTVDKVAAGLSLMLSLKQAGKSVDVVTSDTLRVSHTNLFGIGEVKSQVVGGSRGSMGGGGTFTLTLEGVVDDEGNVNSEKLDYFQEGKNLQLIFTIPAGKKFEPERITTNYSGGTANGGGYDLIFVVGADNLSQLGAIFSSNESLFAGGNVINIDISQTNGQFGATNIIDINASSLSEMMIQILPDLGLDLSEDMATNLLTGIYDATSNMSMNVKPDTFVAASAAMSAGGKLPVENVANQGFVNGGSQEFVQPEQLGVPPVQTVQPEPMNQPQQSIPVVMDQPQQQTHPQQVNQNPFMQPQSGQNQPPAVGQGDNSNFDLRQVFNLPVDPVSGQKDQSQNQQQNQAQNRPSEEERPQGERVTTNGPEVQNPAPDWLVPKIYKSGS